MHTSAEPSWNATSGPSTTRFRIVSGSSTPWRTSAPYVPEAAATAPGSSRLWWLCTAPLGKPVVPLVYAIAAGACRSSSSAGRASSPQHANVPGATSTAWRSSPSDARSPASEPITSAGASNARAPESRRQYAFSRAASGLLIPTQIAPSRIAPRKAITMSTSFGRHAATRSPRVTPSAASAFAARFAARSSSP